MLKISSIKDVKTMLRMGNNMDIYTYVGIGFVSTSHKTITITQPNCLVILIKPPSLSSRVSKTLSHYNHNKQVLQNYE